MYSGTSAILSSYLSWARRRSHALEIDFRPEAYALSPANASTGLLSPHP